MFLMTLIMCLVSCSWQDQFQLWYFIHRCIVWVGIDWDYVSSWHGPSYCSCTTLSLAVCSTYVSRDILCSCTVAMWHVLFRKLCVKLSCVKTEAFKLCHSGTCSGTVCHGIFGFLVKRVSDLTLLVGRQEKHLAYKNWLIECWHGYLSGVRCKWFAYGPAHATATHHLLFHWNPEWFCLSGAGLPGLSWKKPLNRCSSEKTADHCLSRRT